MEDMFGLTQVQQKLSAEVTKVAVELFAADEAAIQLQFQETRKEFEGDITLVAFALTKLSRKSPEETGGLLGEALCAQVPYVTKYNVVKGFLNLSIDDSIWLEQFASLSTGNTNGVSPIKDEKTRMVEYSSPNTNKPLHLGHLRNIFLGYSVASILKRVGKQVVKAQIINDRGIHICKSMVAWQKFANGETPETSGLKGDKLVGKYYVAFDKAYKEEIAILMAAGKTEEEAKKEAPIFLEAQDALQKWEAGDEATVALWKTMNAWVYAGFDITYKQMGVDFDKLYYESDTYLLGKDIVQKGLSDGVFYQKEDGSIWIDLTEDGFDHKLLLRGDGTAVYITQDIGTAVLRYQDYPSLGSIVYTVGNEQDYHFNVLFKILEKLGYAWATSCYHLSYGMVDLPSGKMKSREGTVVDADDLMAEMVATAGEIAEETSKLDDLSAEEKKTLFNTVGMGALKYFLLRIDPKKRMLFNPAESVDFNGNTGPFIQYTYARINSILRKQNYSATEGVSYTLTAFADDKEKELLKTILEYGKNVHEAAADYNPAQIAAYVYELAKTYNGFYQSCQIAKEDNVALRNFRIELSAQTASIIEDAMALLGINVPDRM